MMLITVPGSTVPFNPHLICFVIGATKNVEDREGIEGARERWTRISFAGGNTLDVPGEPETVLACIRAAVQAQADANATAARTAALTAGVAPGYDPPVIGEVG